MVLAMFWEEPARTAGLSLQVQCGQLASDWVALGLIQILKHCAKK